MKAIILAAGYATRLYPLTENFPKPLLEVGGKPILDWLIDDLSSVVSEFIVVTNHKFADHFTEWSNKHSEKITVVDDGTLTNETRLGAVRDLQLALEGKENDDYLVMAGDNVLSFSLKPFVEFYKNVGTSCVMCHVEEKVEKLRKTAVITLDENQRITSYEEKPENPRSHFAVPPFYIYRSEDVIRIQEALDAGCNPDAPGSFAAWLSSKTDLHAYKMPGVRHDIGDMKSYEAVKSTYSGPEK
ncbi:nucleotidyltransferase family protein [Butyrivibrio sp. YAB3001]|uniref:nucleotidyltransferase family protein n=1 Tax=Butyrivibrio sp. YAB3001 TaxID=1520812 RepID=UPI0008F662F7|nr:nucleotidyltransferase family protein [Butyrivibrio sp. YAB3001]SFC12366.1 glucose-1-phosphate thymidylyltransferase [Butyrivibrio sp. YAB3001]